MTMHLRDMDHCLFGAFSLSISCVYCVNMFMCVAVCVQVDICRGQRLVFMFSSVALSLTPELTVSRRTAGQQAPGILLPLPTQL